MWDFRIMKKLEYILIKYLLMNNGYTVKNSVFKMLHLKHLFFKKSSKQMFNNNKYFNFKRFNILNSNT